LSVADSIEPRPSASARLRASLGQRGIAFLLALAIELLVALLLWFIVPNLDQKKPPPTTATFGIDTVSGDTEEPARTEQKKAAAKSAAREKARPELPKPAETPIPEPEQTPLPSTFVRMTRREYAAADIARKGSEARVATDQATVAAASPGRAGDSAVIGKAPNGEPLYGLEEWYRGRGPSNADFASYRSSRAYGPGWGQVACRTVADHRVEDCQETAEAPRGSGYAGTVRQAAWQFRVRAPRVNGREMTGAWVSIRITFNITASDAR
jgi:hypothetical protein